MCCTGTGTARPLTALPPYSPTARRNLALRGLRSLPRRCENGKHGSMRNSTKTGRGTRPRGSSIEVWLTPEERAEITARAVESHHSQSSFLRAAVFGEPVQSKSDLDALKELAKVGGDVGRVAGVLKLWLAEQRGQGARPIDVEIAMADCRELQATITATMSRTAFGKRRNK